jgi:hypothetical protein
MKTYRLARYPMDSPEWEMANIMTKATNEELGTVASLATKFVEENNETDADCESSVPWQRVAQLTPYPIIPIS